MTDPGQSPGEPAPGGETQAAAKGLSAGARLGILAMVLASFMGIAWATGLTEKLELETIRETIESSGPWGVLIFVAATVAGNFVQVPAVPFIVLAQATWGVWWGSLYAWIASFAASVIVFHGVRLVGGTPGKEIKAKWARRVLSKLDERPLLVVFILRAVFVANPPVTYALALSGVKPGYHLLGSALGLVIPVVMYAVLVSVFGWAPGG